MCACNHGTVFVPWTFPCSRTSNQGLRSPVLIEAYTAVVYTEAVWSLNLPVRSVLRSTSESVDDSITRWLSHPLSHGAEDTISGQAPGNLPHRGARLLRKGIRRRLHARHRQGGPPDQGRDLSPRGEQGPPPL